MNNLSNQKINSTSILNIFISYLLKKEKIEDKKFIIQFGKIYSSIVKQEQHKYLPPKFSESTSDLAKRLGFIIEQSEKTPKNSNIQISSKQQQNEQNLSNQKSQDAFILNNSQKIPTKSQSKLGINKHPIQNKIEDTQTTLKSGEDNLNSSLTHKKKLNNIVIDQIKESGDDLDELHETNNLELQQDSVIQDSDVEKSQLNTTKSKNSNRLRKNKTKTSPYFSAGNLMKNSEDLLVKINPFDDPQKYINLQSQNQDFEQDYEKNDEKLKKKNELFLNQWNKLCQNIQNQQLSCDRSPQQGQKSQQQGGDLQLDHETSETQNFYISQKQRSTHILQQTVKSQQQMSNQILSQKILNMQIQKLIPEDIEEEHIYSNKASFSIQKQQTKSPFPKKRSITITNQLNVKSNNRYYAEDQSNSRQSITHKKDMYKKQHYNRNSSNQSLNFSSLNKNSSSNLRILPELNQSLIAQNQSFYQDQTYISQTLKKKINNNDSLPNLDPLNQSNLKCNSINNISDIQILNSSLVQQNSKNLILTEEIPQQFQNRFKLVNEEKNQDSSTHELHKKKQKLINQNRESKILKTEALENKAKNYSPIQTQINQSYAFNNHKISQNGEKSKKSPYGSNVRQNEQFKNKSRRICSISLESEQSLLDLDSSISKIYKESKAYSTQCKENKNIMPYAYPQSTKNSNNQNQVFIQTYSLQKTNTSQNKEIESIITSS